MKTLHLFAGAGGGLLADLILGHEPMGAVEIEPYCCEILRRRADEGWFPGLRVHETDIRLFDPSEYAGRVDCVSGGFPCQDISAAGRGEGIAGERSGLWAEFARVIRVVRPRHAFIENSPMLTLRGLDVVLSDLAALGYDAEWAVVSAADAGAPHFRERIWIMADATSQRWGEGRTQSEGWQRGPAAIKRGASMANPNRPRQSQPQGGQSKQRRRPGDCRETGDANGQGLEKRQGQPGDDGAQQQTLVGTDWWQLEPDVGRVAHGVARRVDRLKALGNGQVPLQAALAWKILSRQG